jgi:uncharacterized DUF497 family protein
LAVSTWLVDFEWNPDKAASNLAKHGVDFSDATRIFDDPLMLLLIDSRTYGERRYKAIGTVNGRVLFVAYTMRGDDLCRIISARRASRRERAGYSLPIR